MGRAGIEPATLGIRIAEAMWMTTPPTRRSGETDALVLIAEYR